MATAHEQLPQQLTSSSEPPPLFDGTTRLYTAFVCSYAQRAWITRNCKVPSLEHDNKVLGESLDIIKYIDTHFEGPSLFPEDPAKKEFGEHLLSYVDSFTGAVMSSFKGDIKEADAAFDYLENALNKFGDGPFFLGQFSLVDIAYAPFIERYQIFLQDVKQYDITSGRPKLAIWVEELNKIEGYTQTKHDPKAILEAYKRRFAVKE